MDYVEWHRRNAWNPRPSFVSGTARILGGLLWVLSTTLLGYALGLTIPDIDRYLHLVIAIVVFLSILPSIIEWRKHKKR